jgi:trans-aconitate methyltransferase
VDATRASLLDILVHLEAELARGASFIELDVVDPDRGRGLYAGEAVAADAPDDIHRPLRVWLDLAERLGLRLCMPRLVDDRPGCIRLRFEPLDRGATIRGSDAGTEKYGTRSDFARIRKHEDPGFVVDMRDALERVTASIADAVAPERVTASVTDGAAPVPSTSQRALRVLYLGCNTGDEIALVRALWPRLRASHHVGVDHSASAIAAARARFAAEASLVTFKEADVAASATLAALGRFDLVISIGTLQSGALDDRELLRRIVQECLAPRGAIIVGVPNCRYVDGELEYGARMKNFHQPELGLLVKDIAFYRKYLQQHHKQVFVTGKYYVLVTAVDARDP